ncbi:hypothetical protein K488DRAFT_48821, partial [Vararia minispora EC-137]
EKPNEYYFFLALRAGTIERPIARPTIMNLSVHPRELHFKVFAFPPKSSIPAGCLWSLRVWLSYNDIDHRLFSEERLWIASDPDFHSIEDARLAKLHKVTSMSKVYKVPVGALSVNMIATWSDLGASAYRLSLSYEHEGVGCTIFDNVKMRLDCPPEDIHFVIYLIPAPSTPRGATYRLRVWIRFPASRIDSNALPNNQETICQRIWSSEEFKVGHALDFSALGRRTVIGMQIGVASNFTSVSELTYYAHDQKVSPHISDEVTDANDGGA